MGVGSWRRLVGNENHAKFGPVFIDLVRNGKINLCQENQPVVLWVDAISINQNDVPEKNAQVPLMGEIYSEARAVVAHIGDCPPTRISLLLPESYRAELRPD